MATRSSAARKTAGVRGKRITAKQKSARRLNIAVARKHKKKSSKKNGGWTPEKIKAALKNIEDGRKAATKRQKANSSEWMPGSYGYRRRGF